MRRTIKRTVERCLPWLLKLSFTGMDPLLEFGNWETGRLNQRRLEHLATLGLPVAGRSVLEVGAGIGNLTHFFLDRRCEVTTTEARPENLKLLKARYPGIKTEQLDMDRPDRRFDRRFEIGFCYGLLYHLKEPAVALAYLASECTDLLLLETCVSFGDTPELNPCSEDKLHMSQAVSGVGCRPTRPWVVAELQRHFEHCYLPTTQPNHEQFPVDWTRPAEHRAPFSRAVFVASRRPLDNPLLRSEIPDQQTRH